MHPQPVKMNTNTIFSSMQRISGAYSDKLQSISDVQFEATPPIGGWSYSEVYAHIFDASLLSLHAMEDCLNGKGKDKPTAFAVKLILFFGALPPGRYKIPQQLEGRAKIISKDQAEDLIGQFKKQLEAGYKQIPRARDNVKSKHPKLGYLNAQQWFRFTEVHLKHHLKQLHRIEKSFAQ